MNILNGMVIYSDIIGMFSILLNQVQIPRYLTIPLSLWQSIPIHTYSKSYQTIYGEGVDIQYSMNSESQE